MKLVFCCLIIIFFTFKLSYAINDEMTGNMPINTMAIPPSPTAGSLGQFGSMPVGLFTGTPNVSIPIYTLESSQLSVPISLSYGSNGIKVDEVASWVGLGWNLNAGGVITRTIYDETDGQGTWNMNDKLLPYSAATHDFIRYSAEEGFDSQPDIFSFNFMGQSGRFFIDMNVNKVTFIPYSNLKVEFSFSDDIDGFVITDEKGIKYYFGEDNGGYEYTKSITLGTIPIGNKTEYKKTAWYLTRIEHPLGDYIEFEYDNNINTQYSYIDHFSQTMKFLLYSEGCSDVNCDQTSTNSYNYTNNFIKAAVLKRIITRSNNIVEFESVKDRTDLPSGVRLDKIKVINSNGESLKTFQFTQDFFQSQDQYKNNYVPYSDGLRYRMYLLSIQEYGSDLLAKTPYVFEYYNRSLPPRLSMAQDHWGYYNGRNNSNFIPDNPAYRQLISPNVGADRNPNSFTAYYGLLKKITYPVKGYTELFYESNSYYGPTVIEPPKINSTFSLVSEETASEEWMNMPVMLLDQKATFKIGLNTICPDGAHPPMVTVTIKDLSTNAIVNLTRISPTGHKDDNLANATFAYVDLYDDPNTYEVSLKQGVNYQICLKNHYSCMSSNVVLTYSNTPIQTVQENQITGGVRVSKMVDFDGQQSITKKYFYNEYLKRDISSGTSPENFIYSSSLENRKTCNLNNYKYCHYQLLHSASQNSLYNGSSNICYSAVTESIGENFEGGGIERFYTVEMDYNATSSYGNLILSCPKTNTGWKSGTMYKESNFKIVNNSKIITKTVDYQYSEDLSKHYEKKAAVIIKKWDNFEWGPYSITLTQKDLDQFEWSDCTKDHNHWLVPFSGEYKCLFGNETKIYHWPQPRHYIGETVTGLNSPDNYDISEYSLISGFNKLDYSITTNYDANGQNGVSTRTDYFYESTFHSLQTRVNTTDSEGNIITKKFKYPIDMTIVDNEACDVARNLCRESSYTQWLDCVNQLKVYEHGSEEYQNGIYACNQVKEAANAVCEQEYNSCLSAMSSDQRVNAIKKLQVSNILVPPMESLEITDNKLTAASFTEYKLLNDRVVPSVSYTTENLLPSSNIDFSTVNAQNQLILRSDYKPSVYYDSFDGVGNLLQFHNKDNISTSYLWSYNQVYPVAELLNGKFSSEPALSEASYIGFESGEMTDSNPDNDYWSVNRTGQSFTPDAKVGRYAWYMTSEFGPTRSVKPASSKSVYTFSGWAKTPATYSGQCYFVLCANDDSGQILPGGYTTVSIGNTAGQWRYFQVTLNLSNVTSSIATVAAYPWKPSGSELYVDELRLQPQEAQMTTFTYSPLQGMRSRTDANGVTTTYDYDSFGRLEYIRDYAGNIIQKNKYNYSSQVNP